MCFAGVLELNTLDTRRFLFQLPELLSRWLDQAFLRPDKFPRSTMVRSSCHDEFLGSQYTR
jgi:hypothetical protein